MSKIVDYEFVVEASGIKLSEYVRKKLTKGYSLYGNPVMTVDACGSYRNGQAMVKYAKKPLDKNIQYIIDYLILSAKRNRDNIKWERKLNIPTDYTEGCMDSDMLVLRLIRKRYKMKLFHSENLKRNINEQV